MRQAGWVTSKVDIRVRCLDPNRFELQVRDTGIGIKPEDISRLFTEFEQLDSGTARRFEGTGLGLALTRKIVEMQGGAINVESEVGKGARFIAELPMVICHDSADEGQSGRQMIASIQESTCFRTGQYPDEGALPANTEIVPFPPGFPLKLVTAKSSLPSPFKSAATTKVGWVPRL